MGQEIRFVLGGRTFKLNALENNLDQVFIDLHAAYFGASPFNWDRLDQAAGVFLSNTPNRNFAHNLYFNNFTILWNNFLGSGNFDEAERIWQMALNPVLEFESSNPGREAHKGTAYYYWGITAILRGDIDKGYTLMHQAVEEDIATTGNQFPDTPAYAFANLNFAKQDQTFRQWVVLQAQFLNTRLSNYSTQYARSFSLEILRTRFLNSPPSTDIVFLFAFTIARLMRLSSAPAHTLQSKFSGQLLINLFFDITLTIETAAKAKNPGGNSFINHAKFISQRVNNPLTINQLKYINSEFIRDFDGTLKATVDGSFVFPDGTPLNRIQSDIAVAYGIRNRGGHDVSSSPTVWKEFNKIEQTLLNVLFMTVDFAY